MKVLCGISEQEFLVLRGNWFQTATFDGDHFAVLFEKERLSLSFGEYVWTFRLPQALRGSKHRLFIEEHPYCGPSRRQDTLMVVKSVCGIGGKPLAPVMGAFKKYRATQLATVSRYAPPKNTVTIKELRVALLDLEHGQLIVRVWRGGRDLVSRHPHFKNYFPVVQDAEVCLWTLTSKKKDSIALGSA